MKKNNKRSRNKKARLEAAIFPQKYMIEKPDKKKLTARLKVPYEQIGRQKLSNFYVLSVCQQIHI